MRHLYKVVVFFVLLLALSACGTPVVAVQGDSPTTNQVPAATAVNVVEAPTTSTLLGTWQRITSSNDASSFGLAWMEQIEFLKDGTLVTVNSMSGVYSFPEEGRIKIEFKNGSETHKYSISGDTLTFDFDAKKSTVYKKIK